MRRRGEEKSRAPGQRPCLGEAGEACLRLSSQEPAALNALVSPGWTGADLCLEADACYFLKQAPSLDRQTCTFSPSFLTEHCWCLRPSLILKSSGISTLNIADACGH